MKKALQITIFILCLLPMIGLAKDDKVPGKKGGDGTELQRKSEWGGDPSQVAPGGLPGPEDFGFPRDFNEFSAHANKENAAISTGYYYYDSDERNITSSGIKDIWKPGVFVPDTSVQPNLWTKVVTGPRVLDSDHWDSDDNTNGRYFFRNPADGLTGSIFDRNRTGDMDTTDNAVAGPIPIGIKGGFFFNGLRYDSFYLSTNGVVALTNRRYVYGSSGTKAIPPGGNHCYDIFSMDWFVEGPRTRINPSGDRYIGTDPGETPLNDGILDMTRDDFGYYCSVFGRSPLVDYPNPASDPYYNAAAGIRGQCGANLSSLASYPVGAGSKPALISPFWGDLQLSQYNPDLQRNDGFGSAYFKRTITNDSLVIGFFGVTFIGTVADVRSGSMSYGKDARASNTNNFVEWDAKIILDRQDSSIYVVYERLAGTTARGATCGDAIRANTTAGVYGFARHVNYDSKDETEEISYGTYTYPWAGEYRQYTHYFSKYIAIAEQYPYSGSALRYKQWKNTLRVANITYLVHDTEDLDSPTLYDFTKEVPAGDYELLAGEPLLGQIQPRVLIQSLTNDIQGENGVNFVEQDFEFWARFKIRNLVTGEYFYNRAVPVSANCMSLDDNWDDCVEGYNYIRVRLCNSVISDPSLGYKVNSVFSGQQFIDNDFDGVPPYRFVRIDFEPFTASEYIDNHIGRLRSYVIAEPKDIKNRENIGDQWPFDDTTSTRFFVMKRLQSFQDDITEFHQDVETFELIPSVLKWVTLEADVMNGLDVGLHPLPPRGVYFADMPGAPVDPTAASVIAPVFNINRLQGQFEYPSGSTVATEWGNATLKGDEIRSYPIDLRARFDAVFAVSVQRDGRPNVTQFQNYSRSWGEDAMRGPEGKTFINNNPFAFTTPSKNPSINGKAGPLDLLVVEFAKPSDDGVNGICNIEEDDWRHLPFRRGTDEEALTNMPVLTIYGSGGYLRGFLESDRDSVLKYPNSATGEKGALRDDMYDTGYDWEFQRYSTGLPDTLINWKNEGAKNIRFRLRVLATNHQINPMIPTEVDDADNFYIDNVNILFPDEITDIEMNSVRIQWPYSEVPPSQSESVPIYVKVANGTSRNAPQFSIKVKVFKEGDFDYATMKAVPGKYPIYCRLQSISNLLPGQDLEVSMPTWNVRKHMDDPQSNSFTLVSYVLTENDDLIPSNDTTYFDVDFETRPWISYEPSTGNTNGAGSIVTNAGLSTPGSSNSGQTGIGVEDRLGYGLINEPYAGKIASKFKLQNVDDFYGFLMYLGSMNSGPDVIKLLLYKGNDLEPSTEVLASLNARRGRDIEDIGVDAYGQYWLEDGSVELGPGTYWVAVEQLTTEPLCLGGAPARARMKIMNHYISPDDGSWGAKGRNIFIDRNLRVLKNRNWRTTNYFAYMNGIPDEIEEEVGRWEQFTPELGNLGYPHTNHRGLTEGFARMTNLYLNSSWIPMIRPIFANPGSLAFGSEKDVYIEQDCDGYPVELVGFKANKRLNAIDLIWETASEDNNSGFELQRRISGTSEWIQIVFVEGAGNSVTHKYYSHTDTDVTLNTTYQYRIRQIDADGTVGCPAADGSDVLTVTYDVMGEFHLAQNVPNPVDLYTKIDFFVPFRANVRIEVLNMLGNVVAELTNKQYNTGNHTITWNCQANDDSYVPNGAYVYRLIVNDKVISKKMTVIR